MNVDLPTMHTAGGHSGFAVGDQKQAMLGSARLSARFQNLGLVLERLWTFHQAMRAGRPLEQSDEMLAEVGSALKRTKGR